MTVRRSPPSGLESQEDRSRPSSSLSFSHLNFYGLFTPSFDGQHASSPSGSQARLRELPIHRVLTRPFDPTPLQFVPLSLLYIISSLSSPFTVFFTQALPASATLMGSSFLLLLASFFAGATLFSTHPIQSHAFDNRVGKLPGSPVSYSVSSPSFDPTSPF